ncbi:hypothetical protein [Aquamicrobium defluvii]|uniref:Uncharacterized protein n=1 Tax=Aquamicrobium defluvii TaxID=69279 RepID=A0A4R6YF18_9HYPH|nr:hypothetical protein [Aquamicrobium defluvii]TDR34706.1 hypothetical protein DES43_113137 [Aquamicrobium defluvii]
MDSQTEQVAVEAAPDFEWAIVEIMGHRKHAGRVREEERFGAKMLRVDVPKIEMIETMDEAHPHPLPRVTGWTTHWYGGPSIFSFTLTDEESVMRINRPYYSPQRYIAPPHDPDFDEVEFDGGDE